MSVKRAGGGSLQGGAHPECRGHPQTLLPLTDHGLVAGIGQEGQPRHENQFAEHRAAAPSVRRAGRLTDRRDDSL